MTWTNALTIGPCTVNAYINPSYPLNPANAATQAQLTAAGLTLAVDMVSGQITLTWDGITGAPPGAAVQVVPSYAINGMAARLANASANSPAAGMGQVVNTNYVGSTYNPIPQPWDMIQQPITDFGAWVFYGA